MSRKDKYIKKSLIFRDVYHLVDCLMLFGGSLQSRECGCCMVLSKKTAMWPSLAWASIVAQAQDRQFSFLLFDMKLRDDLAIFTTHYSRFLQKSYDRWYPNGGRKKVPADLVWDDMAILFWMTGAWSKTRETIFLPCRGGSETPVDWMRKKGWEPVTRHGGIILQKDRVTDWFSHQVPRSVWS